MIPTKTIDSIVNELLIECDLSKHFYVKFLYSCLEEYRRLAQIMGINAKEVTVSFSETSTAASGTYEGVTYSADNLGTYYGDIDLIFDGASDIDTIVGAWNTSNPNNTITHDGTGTDVPSAGSLTLSGATNARRAALPEDFQHFVGVYVNYGERKRVMVRDSTITKKYNLNGNDTVTYSDAEYAIYNIVNTDADSQGNRIYYDYDLTNYGGLYGVAQEDDKNYEIDFVNSELIFSNQCSTGDEYTLVYIPVAVSDSVANVVEYMYIDTIKEYAKLQRLKSNRSYAWEVKTQEKVYSAAKKRMRAHKWPATKALALKAIQKGMHAGPK